MAVVTQLGSRPIREGSGFENPVWHLDPMMPQKKRCTWGVFFIHLPVFFLRRLCRRDAAVGGDEKNSSAESMNGPSGHAGRARPSAARESFRMRAQ